MTTRYDVTAPRSKQDGGTFWHRIGTAFEAKEGAGMNVILDSLPLPDKDGRVSFIIRPAKDLREASSVTPAPRARQAAARAGGGQVPIDDNIPF